MEGEANTCSRVGGASCSGNYNGDGVHGKPQETGTPGHDKASVNLANKFQAQAQANGEQVDSTHFNRTADKATDGAVPSNKRPDAIVNSTAKDGTKVVRLGEAVSTASGQTIANQTEKLNGIANTARRCSC